MRTLSARNDDGTWTAFAPSICPQFLPSDVQDEAEIFFEIQEEFRQALKSRVGESHLFSIENDSPIFFGQLKSFDRLSVSNDPMLRRLGKSTSQGVIVVLHVLPPGELKITIQ